MPSVPAACGQQAARRARAAATASPGGGDRLEVGVVGGERGRRRRCVSAVGERAHASRRACRPGGRASTGRIDQRGAAGRRAGRRRRRRCASGRRGGGAGRRGPSTARRRAPGRTSAGRNGGRRPSAATTTRSRAGSRPGDVGGDEAGPAGRTSAATTVRAVAGERGGLAAGRGAEVGDPLAGLGADRLGHPLRREVLDVAVVALGDRRRLVHRLQRGERVVVARGRSTSRSTIQSG